MASPEDNPPDSQPVPDSANNRIDSDADELLVPDDVIPHGALPPLKYRDLPEPVPLSKMIGPSIMLAGLALGSGEFVLWPYLTYNSQFVFFWACLLGVATQFFINMEIARWTLATGESAITGFARLSRHWASVFLVFNIVPWVIPGWAKGAAQILSWLIDPAAVAQAAGLSESAFDTPLATWLAVGSMVGCGLILTGGKVVYETVERIQLVLVGGVLILVIVLAVLLVRPDAIEAQISGAIAFRLPAMDSGLSPALLLGALAFAGVGGTLNLGQSNYIKDKGYAMGRYIGRITSPITGQEEPISEIGYHFPATAENQRRWRAWWRAANIEHFFSFFLTCLVCLVSLTLIAYSIFYTSDGERMEGAERFGNNIGFIWGEAEVIGGSIGPSVKLLFLAMGAAILLTTEIGVLDAASRISADIVKVNWFRDHPRVTESRLYYLFLWGTILIGSAILLLGMFGINVGAFALFTMSAALNGLVMFCYCGLLLYLNRSALPPIARIGLLRVAVMVWAVGFFGFFATWLLWEKIRSAISSFGA